jgi:predicted tellurium resistance membrane protein TerC
MTPVFYHYLHLVGALFVFASIGGMLAVAGGVTSAKKLVGMLHGIGLVILLVAGFGFLAKAKVGYPYPNWVWAKMGIWLVLGILPLIVRKRFVQPGVGVMIGILLGATAAYLGYFKPF